MKKFLLLLCLAPVLCCALYLSAELPRANPTAAPEAPPSIELPGEKSPPSDTQVADTAIQDSPQLVSPPTLSATVNAPSRTIEAGSILVRWTPELDNVWGFSKTLGKWAEQKIDPPATDRVVPLLTTNIAVWPTGST